MAAPDQVPTLRRQVEAASRPLLVVLTTRMPRLVVPLATVVLVAIGMFAPIPVALLAFAVVALFVAWIAFLAWPAITLGGKTLRVLMIALVIGLAVSRLTA